jgi:glycosyltransferase involved in cell wall biosynthesis
MAKTAPLLSLVVPFFNESVTVIRVAEALLSTLRHAGLPHELLMVDNGSRDDTREYIEAAVRTHAAARLVVVPANLGYGWGVLEGLRQARGDVLGFMVGDGQVKPEAVVAVYRKLVEDDLSLCKAARTVRHDGAQRAALTRIGNRVFRWCFPQLTTTDINGTPKLFTRDLYVHAQLNSKDWFIDAELMIKAALAGAAVGEVMVESPARERGASHVRWGTVAEFLRNVARYRWGGALDTRGPS